MQVTTESKQSERLPMKFEIRNTKSSRVREQMLRKKLTGAPRRRAVVLGNTKLRPRRSEWLTEEQLVKLEEQLRVLESSGLVVVRFDDKNINLDEALRLIRGEPVPVEVPENVEDKEAYIAEAKEGQIRPDSQPQPPFFNTSIVNDPQPIGGADASLLRTMREPVQPKITEPIEVEQVDEDGVVSVGAEPAEPASVDVGSLVGLEFISEAEDGTITHHGPDSPVQEEAEQDTMTVAQAAEFLGKSKNWVRKRIGTLFTKAGENPIVIPYDEVSAAAIQAGEEG